MKSSGAVLLAMYLCILSACSGPSSIHQPPEGMVLAPPSGLTASSDNAELVLLRFRAPEAPADGYTVLRDGVAIADLSGDALAYRDEGASPGSVGTVEPRASLGTRSDGVELSWLAPSTLPGADHSYAVLARYGELNSEPSEAAVGRRAAPSVDRYEVCREPCSAWTSVAGLTYVDQTAPLAQLIPGRALGVARTVPEGAVSLTAAESEVRTTRVEYRVRVVSGGRAGEPSLPAGGYRKAGPLRHQWQRSDSARGASFVDLPGVTGISWADATAPFDADVQYRVSIRAEGAESALSEATSVHTQEAVAEVEVRAQAACALSQQGRVRCWGSTGGWLNVPARGPSGLTFAEIALGNEFVCGLETESKHLRCWRAPTSAGSEPDGFLVSSVPYRALIANANRACAIRDSDDRIVCFNRDGDPSSPFPDAAYRDLSSALCAIRASDNSLVCLAGARQVLAGETFSALSRDSDLCALREKDGLAVCWDPIGGRTQSPVPVRSPIPNGCGLTLDQGEPICWGKASDRIELLLPGANYKAMTRGDVDTCLLTSEGRVRCTGYNFAGLAPVLPASAPFKVTSDHCALDMAGAIHCWGWDEFHSESEALPVRNGFTALSGTCALTAAGKAQCWGALANVPAPEVAFSALRMRNDYACGLTADTGAVLCWGPGLSALEQFRQAYGSGYRDLVFGYVGSLCLLGQDDHLECLGAGPYNPLPEELSGGRYSAVGKGGTITCAIEKESAAIRCLGTFGYNAWWASEPPPGRYTAVSVAPEHACAIREEDARVVCWGHAGLPGEITRAAYTSVDTFSTSSTCALRAEDQKRVCWGQSYLGEAGDLVVTP